MAHQARALGRPIRGGRHRTLALVIMWLLVWRLVIPGFFEYDDGKGGTTTTFADMVQQEALFNNILWFGLLGLALFIVGSQMAAARSVVKSLNPFFTLMIVLAGSSVLWSLDPKASAARLSHAVIIAVVCAAAALAGGWNPRRFQEIMRPILTGLLIGSVLFAALYPDLAITAPIPPDTRYYWHGLASHKNGFGTIAGSTAIFWVHAWLSKEVNSLKALGGLVLSAVCLVLARSSTALMATAFSAMFMLLLMRSPGSLRRYMPYLVGGFAVLVLVYAIAVLKLVPGLDILLTPITALTGKDTTFTDRTRIWDVIENHIRQSPWLGTGYGGYWVGPYPTSASYVFLSIMYIYPWESHNGYLDIVNDLGYIGMGCLIAYIVVYLRQSLSLMRTQKAQATLYLGFVFQGLVTNLSESLWFKPDFWLVTITFATFAMARGVAETAAQGQSRGRR